MVKRFLYIISLLLLIALGPLPVLSTTVPYINDRESSTSLQYGSGNKATLRIDNLTLQSTYILEVATNTNASYNISWFAYSTSADVDFNYAGPLLDIYNNTLTQIELILLDNTTLTTITMYYMTLQQSSSLAGGVSWISSILIVFIYALIGVIAFTLLIKAVSSFTK